MSPKSLPTSVEAEYRARIEAMCAAERIRRAEALFRWSRDYVARSIAATAGPMSDADLEWRLAVPVYGVDPASRELLDGLRRRAGH